MAELKSSQDTTSLDELTVDRSILELNAVDALEGTVFSKAWVLALLVRLVEFVGNDEDNPDSDENTDENQESDRTEDKTLFSSTQTRRNNRELDDGGECNSDVPINSKLSENQHKDSSSADSSDGEGGDNTVNENLENDLCKLWDASANAEMAVYLHGHNVVELLVGCIARCPHSTRITEICIGIIGNMVCHQRICHEAIGTLSLRDLFSRMLGHHDSAVLIESIRLISTCLSHETEKEDWLACLSSSSSLLHNISYILTNSTNEDLLRVLSSFIDRLLDLDEGLCSKWSCYSFMQAICEASDQCRLADAIDISCTLILILQSLTTSKEGVQVIVTTAMDCVSLCLSLFLQSLYSNDYYYGPGSTDGGRGLMAALSLCNCIIDNSEQPTSDESSLKTHFRASEEVISFLVKLSSSQSIGHDNEDSCWNETGLSSIHGGQQQWKEMEDQYCSDGIHDHMIRGSNYAEETRKLAQNILIYLKQNKP